MGFIKQYDEWLEDNQLNEYNSQLGAVAGGVKDYYVDGAKGAWKNKGKILRNSAIGGGLGALAGGVASHYLGKKYSDELAGAGINPKHVTAGGAIVGGGLGAHLAGSGSATYYGYKGTRDGAIEKYGPGAKRPNFWFGAGAGGYLARKKYMEENHPHINNESAMYEYRTPGALNLTDAERKAGIRGAFGGGAGSLLMGGLSKSGFGQSIGSGVGGALAQKGSGTGAFVGSLAGGLAGRMIGGRFNKTKYLDIDDLRIPYTDPSRGNLGKKIGGVLGGAAGGFVGGVQSIRKQNLEQNHPQINNH